MKTIKLECCECGWLGDEDQRVRKPCTEPGMEGVSDMACPRCSHVEFYEIKAVVKKQASVSRPDLVICDDPVS